MCQMKANSRFFLKWCFLPGSNNFKSVNIILMYQKTMVLFSIPFQKKPPYFKWIQGPWVSWVFFLDCKMIPTRFWSVNLDLYGFPFFAYGLVFQLLPFDGREFIFLKYNEAGDFSPWRTFTFRVSLTYLLETPKDTTKWLKADLQFWQTN